MACFNITDFNARLAYPLGELDVFRSPGRSGAEPNIELSYFVKDLAADCYISAVQRMRFVGTAIEIDLAHRPIPIDKAENLRIGAVPRWKKDRSLDGKMRKLAEMRFQCHEPSWFHHDIVIQESQDIAFCHGNRFV